MKKFIASVLICSTIRYYIKDNLEYLIVCVYTAAVLAAIAVYLQGRDLEKK